jgi:hypothetical protein
MYRIPWNVLNKMLIDASYFEYDKEAGGGGDIEKLKKKNQIALTDENADELLNAMLGKAKLKK